MLDLLERQLSRQEDAFRRRGVIPDAVQPTQPDQPMTNSERVRATDLQQRTDALLYETLEAMAPLRRPNTSPYG